MRVATLLISAVALARRSLGWLAARAVDRAVTPGSLSGISVLMAVCAAGWFSGGAGENGARGLLAMSGWLLFGLASRGLAAFAARRRAGRAGAGASGGGTDWLVLPATWPGGAPAETGAQNDASAAARTTAARFRDEARIGSGLAGDEAAGDEAAAAEAAAAEAAGAEAAGDAVPGDAVAGDAVAGDEAARAEAVDGGDAVAGAMLGFGWLAAISAMAAESAIYGGMAAGSAHATLIGAWPLAVLAVASVALTDVLGACRAAALTAERSRDLGRNPVLRAVGTLLRVPSGLRGLLALAAYGLGGPQAALLAVLGLGAVTIAAAVATLATVVPAAGAGKTRAGKTRAGKTRAGKTRAGKTRAGKTGPANSPAAAARAGTSPRITAIVGVAGSQGETTAVRFTTTPSPAWLAASRKRAAPQSRPPAAAGRAAIPTAATEAQGRDVILALRDDGAVARRAGRLVQGNLIPLPPALAGLIATSMLAALGLHHLPGFIALTPPVVMMLAAPGSSHPHDSRFDWVVPALLAAAQFVYLGSLGFAVALPGPVVFAACAIVAIWYTSNTAIVTGTRPTSPAAATAAGATAVAATAAAPTAAPTAAGPTGPTGPTGPAWGAGLGWESRMFVVGLAATFGLATFGYVGLAAYLGVLICRKVVTGYLVPKEEDRQ